MRNPDKTLMKSDTKFKPGQSGNPAGRKPGPSKQQKLRAAIEADVPGILDALTQAALGGDPAAAKLLLDRCLPVLRPETRQATPAPVDPDGILAATESGLIGLDQAQALMQLCAARVRIAEGQELIQKVESLEAAIREMQQQQ